MEKQGVLRWSRGLRWALLLLAVGLLAACAGVQAKPFEDFQKAATEAGEGLEKATAALIEEQQGKLIVWGESAPLTEIDEKMQITFSDDYRATTIKVSYYSALVNLNAEMVNVNHSLQTYASMLVKLSQYTGFSDSDNDALSKEFKSNIDFLNKIGFKFGGTIVPIISSAIFDVYNAYLTHKRDKDLIDVIRASQVDVEKYCSTIRRVIHFQIYSNFVKEYDLAYRNIYTSLCTEQKQKKKYFEQIVATNENAIKTVKIIEGLENSFGLLPKAHSDLALYVENKKITLTSIHEFLNQIEVIKSRYEDLKKSKAE